MRSKLLITFTVLAIIGAVEGNVFAQSKGRLPLLPGSSPLVPLGPRSQGTTGSRDRGEVITIREARAGNVDRANLRHVDGIVTSNKSTVDPDTPGLTTIPHWSDSFTYHGLVYKYTMVGTDPKRGSATTVIPTVLIPIRFVFADGNVFDPTTDIVNGLTPIQGIINSPIFQNYDFNNNQGNYYFGGMANPVKVGNTQYGDAFQRANFWDTVSTRAPNYHVLLGQPTVLPIQTINVPNGLFSYYFDPNAGQLLPEVDEAFLEGQTGSILTAANVSASMLPIMVWGKVGGTDALGFHGVISGNGIPLQTYIATSYLPGTFRQDVFILSHEILEWMDDPFANNFTSGWDIPGLFPADVRCDSFSLTGGRDLLEVADPIEFFFDGDIEIPGAAYSYHVTEAMFIDFFTRSSRSRSYNGQYSFFEIGIPYGVMMEPSSPCTGHVEFTPTYVDFPGAISTVVNGINNLGSATGYYRDAARKAHGFVFTGSKYSTLDYPGAHFTEPYKINDSGMIAGTFADASGVHGFSYQSGVWTQIDYPGSSDTEVYGINSTGTIVGTYDGSQPVTHAFVLQNGQYQRIDTPFGTQAIALAINDLGSIAGVGYTDPVSGPSTAFILSQKGFSPFSFPDSIYSQLSSINNSNDVAGIFADPDGTSWGMVTVDGYPYQVEAGDFGTEGGVRGNDDLGHICGYARDPNTGQSRGFIGTLPLKKYSAGR